VTCNRPLPIVSVEARPQVSTSSPQISPSRMTSSSTSEIKQLVENGEHGDADLTGDTTFTRSSALFDTLHSLNTPVSANKIVNVSILDESMQSISGSPTNAVNAGSTTNTNGPIDSILGTPAPSLKKISSGQKEKGKEMDEKKDMANELPSYLSKELYEYKKEEIRAVVQAARDKWLREYMPNCLDVSDPNHPYQEGNSELSEEQRNRLHATPGALGREYLSDCLHEHHDLLERSHVNRGLRALSVELKMGSYKLVEAAFHSSSKTNMFNHPYFKELHEAGWGAVSETGDTNSNDVDTKDVIGMDIVEESSRTHTVEEELFVDNRKDAANTIRDEVEPTASDTCSESFIHRSVDWSIPGPRNPFASLVTRPRTATDSRCTDSPRYWIHDKVQDELRHDFRTKFPRKTATDIASTYFESISKETTSEVDCEKIVDKDGCVVPQITADQWRAIYATMFLERCETNGW
jgi:hypothetical protein